MQQMQTLQFIDRVELCRKSIAMLAHACKLAAIKLMFPIKLVVKVMLLVIAIQVTDLQIHRY